MPIPKEILIYEYSNQVSTKERKQTIASFPVWIISLTMTVHKSIYLHENLIFFLFLTAE